MKNFLSIIIVNEKIKKLKNCIYPKAIPCFK